MSDTLAVAGNSRMKAAIILPSVNSATAQFCDPFPKALVSWWTGKWGGGRVEGRGGGGREEGRRGGRQEARDGGRGGAVCLSP